MMSELRLDPTTGEWVIMAGERANRPRQYPRPKPSGEVPPYMEGCPFCPGNEAATPPAVLEVRTAEADSWRLRVFPNKYPALDRATAAPAARSDQIFITSAAVGSHEVLVETPRHDGLLWDQSAEETLVVVRGYHQRFLALMDDPMVKYVLVFKNQGLDAGTSLEHPHSQIIAAPVVPKKIQQRGEIAKEHYDRLAECIYCRLTREEIQAASRVVHLDEGLVVYHPFAAARAAETWIVPRRHQPSFGSVDPEDLIGFSLVLNQTLRRLKAGFGSPDFNYSIQSPPKGHEQEPWSHWSMQIVPRLSRPAGFELGSGIYINALPPEAAAKIMREAVI